MTTDEALAAAERALELSGSDPAAARELARDVLRSADPWSPADPWNSTDPWNSADPCNGDPAAGEGIPAALPAEAAAVAHRALAVAARELGDLPLAEEHLRRAVRVALRAGLPYRAAQARLSLVHVLTELGHPRRALAVATAAESCLPPAETARLAVHRAGALTRLGRYAEALAQCDRAVGALDGDAHYLAGALLNRGLSRVFLGCFGEAEADLRRCAELARGAGLDHVLALAEGNLPFLAARRGDLPAAFAAYRRAENNLFGFPERLATMRCDLAEALVDAHLPGEARALLDLAVPELSAAGAEVALADARLLLARVELRTGDPRRAAEHAEPAAAALAAQGRTALVPLAAEVLLRARLASGPPSRELAAELLSCAADLDGAGRPDLSRELRFTAAETVLRLGDRAGAREQLAVLARRAPGLLRHRAAALHRALSGDRRGAFAAVRAGLTEAGSAASALGDPAIRAYAVGAGEPLARFGLALALETGRGRAVLAWAERWRAVAGGAGRPAAPDVEELRAALGEAALVEFVRDGDGLVAVAVTPERVALRRLGPFTAVAEATVRLRYGLRRAHLRDGRVPGLDGDAALLERLLFGALRRPLGDRPLVVVPTGSLHTLPWPVLPLNAGRPVTVASAAAAWLAGHRAPAVPGGRTVAVAGPALRCAGAEAAMVAARRPGTERVAARRAEVLAALEGAEVAHLAAHGVFSPGSPLLSSIHLDDGPLMAYDLLRLRRPPTLAVLSACDAGMARVPADGAPLGLAGAFLSVGSRCVVASLVPVRDEPALALMEVFHELLAAGHPPARALATASAKTGVAGFVCFGYGDRPVPATRP
ncbi:CHAT domain-containing protein [Streptosporangium sandarakinum]|uniref:CHAT domain-containing protein n=1 Tax=Streptosporangium sandarakinum TaxID=1260955 RepID=UPI0033B36138